MKFSFSLSNAFHLVKQYLTIKRIEAILLVVTNLCCLIIFPYDTLLFIISLSIVQSIFTLIDYEFRSFVAKWFFIILPLVITNVSLISKHSESVFHISTKAIFAIKISISILMIGISVLNVFDYRIQFDKRKNRIGIIIVVALVAFVLYFNYFFKIILNVFNFKYVDATCLILFLAVMLFIFFSESRKIISGYIFYKSINVNMLNNREYIHNVYINLNKTGYYVDFFINYLELHIEDVNGACPYDDFLKITKNKNITRLAKLEEKWLGLK